MNPLSILCLGGEGREEALECWAGCLERDDWSWQTAGSKWLQEGPQLILTKWHDYYEIIGKIYVK